MFKDPAKQAASDFNTYFANQYSAGTPVTILCERKSTELVQTILAGTQTDSVTYTTGNLTAEIHGKTVQTSVPVPSKDNIQMIRGVGMADYYLAFNGTRNWTFGDSGSNKVLALTLTTPCVNPNSLFCNLNDSRFTVSIDSANASRLQIVGTAAAFNSLGITSANTAKEYFARRYENNDRVYIIYETAERYKLTNKYIGVKTNNSTQLIGPMWPLFSGDFIALEKEKAPVLTRNNNVIVLTGQESFVKLTTTNNKVRWGIVREDVQRSRNENYFTETICSHYKSTSDYNTNSGIENGISVSPTDGMIALYDSSLQNEADLSAYLTTQYNAGTPVTIVYRTNTPTVKTLEYYGSFTDNFTTITAGENSTCIVKSTGEHASADSFYIWLKRQNGRIEFKVTKI